MNQTFPSPFLDLSVNGTADESEHFVIRGDVGSPVFAVWIERHARRLGLGVTIQNHSATTLNLTISGPHDLRDAMALGCSLGPWDVMVDTIDRQPA